MNPAFLLAKANTRTDLEAYASRLPQRQYLALRVAWHGDEGDRTRHDLYGLLMVEFVKYLERNRMQQPKQGYMTKIVHLALDELAHPLPGERAEDEIAGKPQTKKQRGLAMRARAKRIGVSERQYYERYRRMYEDIYSIVHDWANTGFRHVQNMQRH